MTNSSPLDAGQYEFLQAVVTQARGLTGGYSAALCLVDSARQELHVAVGSGPLADKVGRAAPTRALNRHLATAMDTVTCRDCGNGCCPFIDPRAAHHHLAAPVRVAGSVRGILCTTTSPTTVPSGRYPPLIGTLAGLAASALARQGLCDLAQNLGALAARQQLAADVHDGVAQTLAYLHMQLDQILDEITNNQAAHRRLGQVQAVLRDAALELRTTIDTLQCPADEACALDEILHAAIGEFDRGTVRVRSGDGRNISRTAAEEVRRVVHEAVANAVRHGRARHVDVGYRVVGHELEITVADDGCGFDQQRSRADGTTHLGLSTMRLRAAALGGIVEISSRPGRGTRIVLRYPVPPT